MVPAEVHLAEERQRRQRSTFPWTDDRVHHLVIGSPERSGELLRESVRFAITRLMGSALRRLDALHGLLPEVGALDQQVGGNGPLREQVAEDAGAEAASEPLHMDERALRGEQVADFNSTSITHRYKPLVEQQVAELSGHTHVVVALVLPWLRRR